MKRSALLSFLAPLVLASSVHAAADYFLEIDGIKGESTDARHGETIEIESFSWGASNTGSPTAGNLMLSDFKVTTKLSKASPRLLVACANGTHIPKATLYVRKAGETSEDYYTIVMSDILVSSYQTGGSAGADDRPTEEVAFYYNRISVEYTGDDGSKTTGEVGRTAAQ